MKKIAIISVLILSLFVFGGCTQKRSKYECHQNPPKIEEFEQQENTNSRF